MTEVKTTFAAHGNPWAQLIKPEPTQKPKMQKQAKQLAKAAATKAQPAIKSAVNKQTPESVANDGWIEWGGGECPVSPGIKVEVMHRIGSVSHGESLRDSGMLSSHWCYDKNNPHKYDITAYRVFNQQSVNQSKPAQPKLTSACAVERIDLNAFEFDDMPFPGRTLGRENKYSKTLKDMPVNKRLKVPIGDAAVVKHGMSRVLKATRPGHILRAIDDCGDGMGGVWLLKDEVKK